MNPVVRSLALPARLEALDLAYDGLAALWADVPEVSERDRSRLRTAVAEVLGNVLEHALGPEVLADDTGERSIGWEVTVGAEVVVVRLEDDGRPFTGDLEGATMPDPDAESGRGLALAQVCLDSLAYERDGGTNRWTLRCERGG